MKNCRTLERVAFEPARSRRGTRACPRRRARPVVSRSTKSSGRAVGGIRVRLPAPGRRPRAARIRLQPGSRWRGARVRADRRPCRWSASYRRSTTTQAPIGVVRARRRRGRLPPRSASHVSHPLSWRLDTGTVLAVDRRCRWCADSRTVSACPPRDEFAGGATASFVVMRSSAGASSRSRIASATCLASGPVSPTGPTHVGHPCSHAHPAISSRVSREQLVVHAEQRLAEADAARIVVVDEDARLVAIGARPPPAPPVARRRRVVAAADRDADVVAVAHQQQLRDLPHRERQADDAVAPIVGARTAARPSRSRGIVSQYAVVCICCSGRSSSPEPTFSFV